jgi:zinc transport system permease protein
LVALFTSISCGVIGTYVVNRRIVFIAGGITHASFGGVGAGYFFGINPIIGAAFFAVLSAFGIEGLTKKMKLRNDSVIAMIWAFGMAVGIIFIYLTPGYAPNLMSYLFGSILTVTNTELIFLVVLTLSIVLAFIFFFKPIQYIAFDEDYLKTIQFPLKLLNGLLTVLLSLTIVLNIKSVGIILLLSLLTIPQNIANLITKSFKKLLIFSSFIAFVASIIGLAGAYYLNIPAGATIVFVLVVMFLIVKAIYLVRVPIKKDGNLRKNL